MRPVDKTLICIDIVFLYCIFALLMFDNEYFTLFSSH
jgi:hypothetical protein